MSIQRKQSNGIDFLDGLFKNIFKILTDEDFIGKARGASSSAFTRKRKLSVQDLVLLLLGFSRVGVRHELDRMFKNLSQNKKNIQTYSKSAFTQYRHKLQVSCLSHLMAKNLDYFEKHAAHKNHWHGYRLIAIDGSSLNLPQEKCLKERFGVSKNQTETHSITARVSVAYDVMNKLVLDACIDNTRKITQEIFGRLNTKEYEFRIIPTIIIK
jgi:hypothetical protein